MLELGDDPPNGVTENAWALAEQLERVPVSERGPYRTRWLRAVAAIRDAGERSRLIATKGVKVFSLPNKTLHDLLAAELAQQPTAERPLTPEELAALRAEAAPILEATNPLDMVGQEFARLGLGGNENPAKLIYLAATGRVLPPQQTRKGSMQAHAQVVAESSAGKSYTTEVVLDTFPPSSVLKHGAGSPKALLYDETPFKHTVLFYKEMDSLPGTESDDVNAAASAIRGLLADDELSWDVVVDHALVQKRREGPTTLITTTTAKADSRQFDTRLFALAISTDAKQLAAALEAQADLELSDTPPTVSPAVRAVQAYIQALAPIDVIIPFVRPLHRLIKAPRMDAPVLRDAARIRTLIKASAILHIHHRRRQPDNRLVAQLADYEVVRTLLRDSYDYAVTGATPAMRELWTMVHRYPGESQSQLAARLGVSQPTISARVKTALARGWLVNGEFRRGYAMKLFPNDPVPDGCALPTVAEVAAAWGAPPEARRSSADPSPPDFQGMELVAPALSGRNGPAHDAVKPPRVAMR
jgi:hypothetical protein